MLPMEALGSRLAPSPAEFRVLCRSRLVVDGEAMVLYCGHSPLVAEVPLKGVEYFPALEIVGLLVQPLSTTRSWVLFTAVYLVRLSLKPLATPDSQSLAYRFWACSRFYRSA